MVRISLDEANKELPKLIEAALGGDEVYIVGHDGQVVQLVPTTMPRRRPRFGSAQGMIWMSDDFDEPLEDFKEYME
jgi:antitoxin (DNA-binding transcriptional repressor) of toxin-antitoxin stability system